MQNDGDFVDVMLL